MSIVEIDTQQLFRGFVGVINQETRGIVVPMGFDIDTPNLAQVDEFFGIKNVAGVIAETAGWAEWRLVHKEDPRLGGKAHSVGFQLTLGESGKSLSMQVFTLFIPMGRKPQEAIRRGEMYLRGDGVEEKKIIFDPDPDKVAVRTKGNKSVVFDYRTVNDSSWVEAPKIIKSTIVLSPNPEGVYVYNITENTAS